MRTKLDPLICQPCFGLNAQILLSAETRAQFALVQDRILAEVKSPLWRCPPETLHVTISPFLSVRSDYNGQKEVLWQKNRTAWTETLKASLKGVRDWTIRFRQIQLTAAAVFAVGEDGGITNLIRRRLNLPESQGWDQVHTTLFRFETNFELPPTDEQAIRLSPIAIVEGVKHITIARESVYPSVRFEAVTALPIPT